MAHVDGSRSCSQCRVRTRLDSQSAGAYVHQIVLNDPCCSYITLKRVIRRGVYVFELFPAQNRTAVPGPLPSILRCYEETGIRLKALPVIRRPLAQVVRVRTLRTACAPYVLESLEALKHRYME